MTAWLLGAMVMFALVGLTILMRRMNGHTITISVRPQELPEGDSVYITGNHPALGNWHPDAVPLQLQADGSWRRQFFIKRNTQLEYKFTRGSWDSEAANEHGGVLPNFRLRVNQNHQQHLEIPHWRDISQLENDFKIETTPEERIKGTIRFHHFPGMNGLKPRDIIVWLPPSYDSALKQKYPVVYMHDGQNLFDPYTSYTGIDWEADETATRLIEEERIREIIIVGIYNTHDRLEEYSAAPLGKRYREFIVQELKPYIDRNYRTRPEREHTATIGSSMGGLVSFLLVWLHSEVFSMAGCFSPSFIYQKNQAIKLIKQSDPPGLPVKMMMDCGGIGGEKLLLRGCKRVLRLLRRKGLSDADLEFHHYPEARHSERDWAERLEKHLIFLYSKV